MSDFRIILGDCIEVMATLPRDSVHSVITDPPYGISLTGLAWDGDDIWERVQKKKADEAPTKKEGENGGTRDGAFNAGKYDTRPSQSIAFQLFSREWAAAALRVLKPGGHMLVFCAPRMYHRMVSGIEDAGFEIRDQLAWVFANGFPKSVDITKNIDYGSTASREEVLRFTTWLKSTGLTAAQIKEATGTHMGRHYLSTKTQAAIPTQENWEKIKPFIQADIPDWAENVVITRARPPAVDNRKKLRKVVTTTRKGKLGTRKLDSFRNEYYVTEPSEKSKEWQGWGYSMKPCFEPILLARKPVEQSTAANLVNHRVGALNIDACRFGKGDPDYLKKAENQHPEGRFPGTLMHDGSLESERIVLDGKARFFFCPKITPGDRGKRTHETVKPTDLMRYLVKLVTPPGGTVLDPFFGSGSTGKACMLEGMDVIGIEMQEKYVREATETLNRAKVASVNLFNPA